MQSGSIPLRSTMVPMSPFVDLMVYGEIVALVCFGGILICMVLADIYDDKTRRGRR